MSSPHPQLSPDLRPAPFHVLHLFHTTGWEAGMCFFLYLIPLLTPLQLILFYYKTFPPATAFLRSCPVFAPLPLSFTSPGGPVTSPWRYLPSLPLCELSPHSL